MTRPQIDEQAGERLPPGQQAILRSFQRHGADSRYLPSDIMDLRVCCAMESKGLIVRATDIDGGFDLTVRGLTLAGLSPLPALRDVAPEPFPPDGGFD